MDALTDTQLLELNQQGLIPGPGETLEGFSRRAAYCQNLKQHLFDELKATLGTEEKTHPEILSEANTRLSQFYGMMPNWIPLFFSNYKLPIWQGGCAWIFQIVEESPTAALIQLRASFQHSSKYLGIYDRSELLIHELSHVGRMAFQEPKFEEFFAYRTAKSAFRRWFGPIFQSSIETVMFVLILGMIMVFDVFLVALNHPEAYQIAFWLKLIPLSLIFLALIRLWKRHKCLESCLKKLEALLGNSHKALCVTYRLTDSEIQAIAKMSPEQIQEYAQAQAAKELRWKVITRAYEFFATKV